ncbi:MAG: FG-GAP-like repeat-containing protein, partial [Mariniphaga sp.]
MKNIFTILVLILLLGCTNLMGAAPTITTFTPAAGAIGSSVTITGTNFNTTAAQNIVFFGATKAVVTAASAISLTVTVPIGATYQYLSVTNLATNLTAYSAKPFIVTLNGSISFTGKVDFTTGSYPQSVSIGDLDGDGKADLAVANYIGNTVSVLRNTSTSGNVSFANTVDLTTGAGPYSVGIGDIDGDGKPDLIVANYIDNTISVLRNTSTSGSITTGSFVSKVDFATGTGPRSVSIGDIDGDGKPDLAVANYNSNSVSVFRNTSTSGTINASSFASKNDLDTGTGSNPSSVNIGDIDGDGKPDLTVANASSASVSVFRNSSTSGSSVTSFAAKVNFTTATGPCSVSIGDIDGDGKPDLAVANYSDNSVSVLRNTSSSGSVSFAAKVDFETGTYPYSVSIGDINGDGKPDLAVANYYNNNVSVYRNTSSSGTVNFATDVDFTTGTNPYSVSIGDIDGDGKPDLAVANYGSGTVSVIRQFSPSPTITSFTPALAGTTATVTITGTNFTGATAVSFGSTAATSYTVVSATSIKAVVAVGTTGSVSVTTPGGTATLAGFTFVLPPTITTFTPAIGAIGSSVTISGTGFNTTAAQNIVFFGATKAVVTAASAISLTVTVPLGTTYQYLSVTNLATNLTAYSAKPFIVTLAGNITFTGKVDFTTGTYPSSLSIGDLDGDGKPDLAVANETGNSVSVLRNNSTSGAVSFAAKIDLATGSRPQSVSIGDIDGDGKPDLAVANLNSSTVSVFRNTSTSGSVSFAAKVDFVTGTGPYSVSIGDIDGDGKPDLAVANWSSNTVSVLRNISTSGDVSFATKVDFAIGSYSESVSIGDIDGDGKPDLAVANSGNSTVSVLRNTSTIGTVSFAAKADFATGLTPVSVSIGDIDGDGKPDLAVANSSNTVSVFCNTSTSGSLSFATRADFTTGHYPTSVNIGDINGDGKPDLAVTNYDSGTISVFCNTSTSGIVSFAGRSDFATGYHPYSVSIGDIDGDGKPDLAMVSSSDNTLSVIRQIIPVPTISSFSPSTVAAGATVTITGNYFTGTTAVSFGGMTATSFNVVSATSILAVVAIGTSGSVSVTTQYGTGTLAGFTYVPPPTITSFTPVSAGTGLTVTITGTNFTGASAVSFGGTAATSFNVVSATSITALVATGTSGTVSLTTPGGTATLAGYTYVPTPTITSFTPVSAVTGANVTITGTNFTGATTVSFGGTAATSFNIDSATSITAIVANGTSGTVSVTTPGGTATLDGFSFVPPPIIITSFTPASGAIGSSVTITGTNFNTTAEQNIVFFGATRAVVTAASATSLTVTVPLGATYQYLSVTDLAAQITAYSAKPFIVTLAGNISFTSNVDVTLGSNPQAVSIGDIDGDGKPDLAVLNYYSGDVSVFLNTSSLGNVSFAAKADFATGSYPVSVSIGDINGDGKPDLAVANSGNSTVSVIRNTSTSGNVSFAAKVDLTTGSNPYSVSMGDIDGDGKPDLAVANYSSNTVSVFRNTSTSGSVSFAVKVDFATGSAPHSVSIGDIDVDGKVDLAVANYDSNTVSVFLNTSSLGNVSFVAKVDFATGSFSFPVSVSIGDIDGDGKPDLAVVNSWGSTVSVFRNTSASGTVSFEAKVDFATGISPYSVSVGDIDGDGKPDLAVTNYNGISVLRNTSTSGNLSFAAKVDFATGSSPESVSIGDIDGDGKPDLAVANSGDKTVSVIRQIIPVPTITSFEPASAVIGETVTITGTNFTEPTAVSFGGTAAASFYFVSATSITAVVANGTSGSVSVTTGGVTASLAGFTFVPPPTITSFTPASAGTGATVTITGTNFTGTTAVSFGGTAAISFTVINANSITAV